MIGRGILNNVFLIHEINNLNYDIKMLEDFHQEVFFQNSKYFIEDNSILQKMKEFWFYYSANFENQSKISKIIKKVKTLEEYREIINLLVFY